MYSPEYVPPGAFGGTFKVPPRLKSVSPVEPVDNPVSVPVEIVRSSTVRVAPPAFFKVTDAGSDTLNDMLGIPDT